jgi:hypothetical protein
MEQRIVITGEEMILESGITSVDVTCSCGTAHFNVQIGEEMLVCKCGSALGFQDDEQYFNYFWVEKEEARKSAQQIVNGDARNLC